MIFFKKFKRKFLILILFFLVLFSPYLVRQGDIYKRPYISAYPYGKNFAFTITDDPDSTSVEKVRPVYDLLDSLGFRTTVAVWVSEAKHAEGLKDGHLLLYQGQTCENKEYLNFILDLQKKGFEIAMHTVSGGHNFREETIAGYEKFRELFGQYPKINIMHSKVKENIYWGKNVFTNPILRYLTGLYERKSFYGEKEDSPYFWGDICQEKTKYVRLWGTRDINTLEFNPSMPYHDPEKPYVNYWFSFSDAFTGDWFASLLNDRNIDKLVKNRGASIVYTHSGSNFIKEDNFGKLNIREDVKRQLGKLAQRKDGWFVTASELLDRLLLIKNLNISLTKNGFIISNCNTSEIDGITIIWHPSQKLYDSYGKAYTSNNEGEIIIENMPALSSKALYFDSNNRILIKDYPLKSEYTIMVLERIKVFITTRLRAAKERLF